jgi:hypothetical protein
MFLQSLSGPAGPPPDSTQEQVAEAYKAALEPLAVGVFDAGAPGAYNSQFTALAAQPEG